MQDEPAFSSEKLRRKTKKTPLFSIKHRTFLTKGAVFFSVVATNGHPALRQLNLYGRSAREKSLPQRANTQSKAPSQGAITRDDAADNSILTAQHQTPRSPNKNKLIEGQETESGHSTPSSRQEKSGKTTLPASVYTFKKLERRAVELKRQKHRG